MPDIQDYENYLFMCVRNQSLNYLKNLNRYQKIRLEQIDEQSLSEIETPENEVLNDELQSVIELAINGLPQRCRLIFFMVREEGMKYKEVANVLSISERTVHAQMCIALKKIGRVVQEYNFGQEQSITRYEITTKK